MEQDEQPPAQPERGECPFGPLPGDSSAESTPPITLLADGRPPIRPYVGKTCVEAVVAFGLSIGGAWGSCCCFGALGISLEIGALMLAVTAKKKIKANPYLTGDGLATAAIVVALVFLSLYAMGSIAMFLSMGLVPGF